MRSHPTRDDSRRNSISPTYSRSPSPYTRSSYRTRTRTPSYSDSFESEDDRPKKSSTRKTGLLPKGGKRNAAKKGGKEKGGKVTPRMLDVVARRMLSAKRVKMNDLRNEVEILKQQIEQLTKENKFLQLQSRRQEKELSKADSANNELPSLLERHNQEMRAIKEHLRRLKDKYENSQKKNKELDHNLTRVTGHLQKLKELTEDKHLQDRDILTRRVNQLEDEVDERDRKIRDLERYIENLQKNHKHELSIEVHRHKDTQKRLHTLESQLNTVENDLKEKEKILEIQNIYSQRIVRAPHHINSSGSTPLHFPSHRKVKTSNSAEIGLTPREKAKLYEHKRRQEERLKALQSTPPVYGSHRIKHPLYYRGPTSSQSSRVSFASHRARIKKAPETNSMQNISELNDDVNDYSNNESETETSMTREEEERLERDRREEEEMREMENERRKKEDEEREREEQERLKRERQEEERRRLEERRQEEEERRRREEERIRREEEEAAAERRRKEFEELQARDAEERKKKDALLAKLKLMDGDGSEVKSKPPQKDDIFITQKSPESTARQTYAAPKLPLDDDEDESIPEIPTLDLATGQQTSGRRAKQQEQQHLIQNLHSTNTNTAGGRNSSSTIHSSASSSSQRKQYNFREQVENMHAGKPAYDDVTVPYLEKQRQESASTHAGDDNLNRTAVYGRRGSNRKPPPGPSATKVTAAEKPDRESQLMEELFGSSTAANASGYQPSALGARSRDASPVGQRGAYKSKPAENATLPWEIDDSSDRMLPRRHNQPRNSIYSRRQASPPGVIDDIEELAL